MRIAIAVLFLSLLCICKKGDPAGDCEFAYEPATTEFTWTAYKFTEKAGVSGTFDRIELAGLQSGNTPASVFQKLSFQVDTSSVNTQNPDRDQKIARSFFQVMQNGTQIKGRIEKVDATGGTIQLEMNGRTKPLQLHLARTDEKDHTSVTLSGDLNLEDWGAQPAIVSLNTLCKELHTGNDGISKLWPDVKLNIKTRLKRSCKK